MKALIEMNAVKADKKKKPNHSKTVSLDATPKKQIEKED